MFVAVLVFVGVGLLVGVGVLVLVEVGVGTEQAQEPAQSAKAIPEQTPSHSRTQQSLFIPQTQL